MNPSPPDKTASALRRRAEDRLEQQSAVPSPSELDTQRLLHELQVHQIELEMQNESLRQAESEEHHALEQLTVSNTALQELHGKLVVTQRQLLQSEKMAAIGQLAAGVAHEINNPVGFVHSNLGTLKEYVTNLLELLDAYCLAAGRCAPDHPSLLAAQQLAAEMDIDYLRDDIGKLLDESQEGLERIKRIVSDLRNFAHVDDAQWQTIDIHTCLESTLNVVWNELKYKATLVKEYGDLPAITCLPGQLSQVFMNLLVNAVQAIKEHGTITLRTGREADSIWIEVVDSGCGIPPENISCLFDPFFTTKPVGSGTGLGLAITYKIVETHHGRIEVSSEVGCGSTFRVILPIQPARTT